MQPPEFDLCKVDRYVSYLGELETKNPSVATKDIYSDFGVLLVPKGSVVSPGVALKLAEHRMQEPLDSSIGLSTRLNSKSLLHCFKQFLEKDDDLASLASDAEFEALLRHLCLQKEFPFAAMQKLTVMAYRLPDLFSRVLGVTLLACLSAQQLKWHNDRIHALFVSALFRDIGLLHLMPADELAKKVRYERNHEELQIHGLMSEKILNLENRYTPEVLQAVRDHHERRDGAGFPRALSGAEVSDLAWMISVMDSLWLSREQNAAWTSNRLANLKPLLKINANGDNGFPYRSLLSLIQKAGLEGDSLPSDVEYQTIATFLLNRNLVISQLYTQLMLLHEQVTILDSGKDQTLATLVSNTLELIRDCGFGNFETMALLIEEDPEMRYSSDELLELDLSQTELFWRISRLSNLLRQRCAKGELLASNSVVTDVLDEFQSLEEESDARSFLETKYMAQQELEVDAKSTE